MLVNEATQSLPRRTFLQLGGLMAAGSCIGWPRGAAAEPTAAPAARRPAQKYILIYLLGGPPHLDMFDLKPEAPAEIRGPFKPVATSVPGMRICEHLPRLAQGANRLSLVRSVGHNNNEHTQMIYYTLTGHRVDNPNNAEDLRPPQRTDYPHLGSALAHLIHRRTDLPGYVAMPEVMTRVMQGVGIPLRGGRAGILGPRYDPLAINGDPRQADSFPALRLPADVANARMDERRRLLSLIRDTGLASRSVREFQGLRDVAIELTGSATSRQLFSVEGEPARLRERYGMHRFGQSLLLARRLCEAGVSTVAVHFNNMTNQPFHGWDTHIRNFEWLAEQLLPMLDQSVSALLEDLEQRGLLSQTLVLCMGEFGRTPKINKDAGRDHWGNCQSVMLAGGGIRGGQVYGSSDKIGAYPSSNPLDPADVLATVYQAMGVDPAQEIRDQLNRPHRLCTGRVVQELLE